MGSLMYKAIEVKKITTIRYVPDLRAVAYTCAGIGSVEQALELDATDVESGAVVIEELADSNQTNTTYEWKIVEVSQNEQD
jgi:hypothetical protein